MAKQNNLYFWLKIATILFFTLTLLVLTTLPSSSQHISNRPQPSQIYPPAAQITPTLPLTAAAEVTATTTSLAGQSQNSAIFNITFEELGYKEIRISGPLGNTEFEFRQPTYWELQEDSFVEFDLSYDFRPLRASDDPPETFGNIRVAIDDETAVVFAIEEPKLDHYRLKVPLPPAALDNEGSLSHDIRVTFEAEFLCLIPHRSTLIIHPTSYVSLNYISTPLNLDLSTYPLPFFQRAFSPDEITFVLPERSSAQEAAGAVSVAAKLGDLTRNRMVITGTLDADIEPLLSSPSATFDQHLVVIGQPGQNRLLTLLDQITELPVKPYRRQMALQSRGPATVSPDQRFTYTLTITNTNDQPAALTLVDTWPKETNFLACEPACITDSVRSVVTWTNTLLDPAEGQHYRLTLQTTKSITSPTLENTATLIDETLGPVNADTISANLTLNRSNEGREEIQTAIDKEQSDYFFIAGDQAVPEQDGIIQEIISPWNQDRAILIITGLNGKAIEKASQAMSSELRFPGMNGPVALVQDVTPPVVEIEDLPDIEMTFQDLGYEDRVIQGLFEQRIDYNFFIPQNWDLTDDASLELHYMHSAIVEEDSVGFTVLLNRTPMATVVLEEGTALEGRLQVDLPISAAEPGEDNRLSIRVIPAGNIAGCEAKGKFTDFWFLVEQSSKISLSHSKQRDVELDLDYFPYPFRSNSSLTELLFALPPNPTNQEWTDSLRIAALLGDDAAGQTILPAVTLGNRLSESDLPAYHIIALGRPTRNGLISQANSELPQPFIPGTDEIQQRIDNVILRLPSGIDLGYLQLVPSPWNLERAFLAVTGTTDQGVSWATRGLVENSLARKLSGNLAFIRDWDLYTFDTRELLASHVKNRVATAVPELTNGATLTNTAIAEVPESETSAPEPASVARAPASQPRPADQRLDLPFWLILLIGSTGLVVVGIFVIAFIQARRQRNMEL